MRRHIVGAFNSMMIIGLVFGDHLIEMTLKIMSHRRVCIFING